MKIELESSDIEEFSTEELIEELSGRRYIEGIIYLWPDMNDFKEDNLPAIREAVEEQADKMRKEK